MKAEEFIVVGNDAGTEMRRFLEMLQWLLGRRD
jgi:hypothetical protein